MRRFGQAIRRFIGPHYPDVEMSSALHKRHWCNGVRVFQRVLHLRDQVCQSGLFVSGQISPPRHAPPRREQDILTHGQRDCRGITTQDSGRRCRADLAFIYGGVGHLFPQCHFCKANRHWAKLWEALQPVAMVALNVRLFRTVDPICIWLNNAHAV